MAFYIAYLCQQQEDRNIPPKKHHEMPFLRGCIAVFLSPKNAILDSSLVASPNYPIHTNIRRARRAPSPKTPFWIKIGWRSFYSHLQT